MKVFKKGSLICILYKGQIYKKYSSDWNSFINRIDLYNEILIDLKNGSFFPSHMSIDELSLVSWDPPMDKQEIWCAGVTYSPSKKARMKESKTSKGAELYQLIYKAQRPELFFKSGKNRTVGHNAQVNIRRDSNNSVAEPELTYFLSSHGTIEGYTIGNDMTARDIEGDNPLYIPQAKTYEGCASIGPCLYVPESTSLLDFNINMTIERDNQVIFENTISSSDMCRNSEELISYLFNSCEFPFGCFLMTGTGIIPDQEFGLIRKDRVLITIDPIGCLVNTVGCR
ncbi:2-dehydro-3-deoxy-D-arabinonate dehydratase [Zhouia amylolytica]|uniref:2-dehydro-3-deoxy-D-arabinonate dehydratase n=1 Tax=Zhouia amylolytica TaxID=376730 RepID=A0A1I6T7B0_9FLAO|nr:fumarylacetoacetate hydrolase family protein [Zhouia amylolytica]SFS85155.1 2-dehydro-3-deoxy-D-arabinonate dehydratase [Zhouia amylolytica]